MQRDDVGRGAVVVTGASTGIGRAAALHLDGLGFRVYAGVRREPDAESLRAEGSPRLAPLLLDVTDADVIETAAKTVAAEVGEAGVAGLVNNAGIGVIGPLEFLPLDGLRRVLEVNVVGVVAVTQAFLPLVRRAGGRVVMVGSSSGILATPFAGAYCASKFAVEALADALRAEVRPWGLHVAVVEPGNIDTPIWEKTQRDAGEFEKGVPNAARSLYGDEMAAVRRYVEESARQAAPAATCSRAIEHALVARRPRTRYRVGNDARLEVFLARWVPDRLRDRILARMLGA